MALYLIDIFSQIREKDINLYTELYQMLSKEFSFIYKPKNLKLEIMLHFKDLNLYPTNSPLYYIAWDNVDELKCKFPNLEFDKKIDDEITPLECAIKYGSELCFNYLRNLGAEYTKRSEEYAVKSGNINIFMQMIEDGYSFDKMINTAADFRNLDIVEYLRSNLNQTLDSIAECMYFGNYDAVSYFLSNGGNINDVYILFLYISFFFYTLFFFLSY